MADALCVGHFNGRYEISGGRHDRPLRTYHVITHHYIEEPTVLNGRDRTTSGTIGQP